MKWLYSVFSDEKVSSISDLVHSKLGRLVYEDEGWWRGEQGRTGQTVHFYIGGSEEGLDPGLDSICIHALERFAEYHEKSLSAISKPSRDDGLTVPPTFTDAELCWFWMKEGRSGFTLRLYESGDSGRIWRVQFENSEIKSVGYDD